MKQVNNNLPPNSQQWVREVEKQLKQIDTIKKQYESTIRNQNKSVASTAETVAEIKKQETIFNLNQSFQLYEFPTVWGAPKSATITIDIPLPDKNKFEGFFRFTIFPRATDMSGGGGGLSTSHLNLALLPNSGPIRSLSVNDIYEDPFGISAESASTIVPFGPDILEYITSAQMSTTLDSSTHPSGGGAGGYLLVEQNIKEVGHGN